MKNSIQKRLASFGISILLIFCLLPVECFASSKDISMTVGESREITSATYTTFTYEWTIKSGSEGQAHPS